MVQIPTYEARVGLETPSYPTVRVDDSVGQGLRALGNSISGVAEHMQAKQKREAAFDTAIGFDKLNENLSQAYTEEQRSAPANGRGLHDTFVQKHLTPQTDQFLSSIQDPELKKEYEQRLGLLRDKWSNDAANGEYEIGNTYSQNAVNDAWKSRAQGISQNPVQMAAYVKEMGDLIDNAPNLTSAQRDEMKRKIQDSAPGIVAESLKQQDPETFYFATGNGTNDERIAFLTKRLVPALEATGTRPVSKDGGAQIATLVGKYHGDAEAALVAYTAGPEAADNWLKAGRDYSKLPNQKDVKPLVQQALTNLGTAALASGRPGNATPKADALQSIRNFESFRSTAYWDVNAWRTGYGSDTVTRADGTVERVTKDTVVTREDAERDLARRTQDFQKTVIGQIGADTWANLSDGAQAALTSVAYNYGSLPASVAAAARGGNASAIAAAIRERGVDNNGVNRDRRAQEAAMVMGDYTPPKGGQVAATEGSPVPYAGAQRSGFISAAFTTMPTANLLEMQGSAADLRIKAADQRKQEKALAESESQNLVSADVASIEQSGKGTIDPADFDATSAKVFQALGPEKHSNWLQDRYVAQRTYDLTSDANSLTPQALTERLVQLKPKGGPSAVADQKVYDAVSKKFDEITKMRLDDPGLAVQQMPDLKDTASKVDWTKPQSVQDYLGQVEAAQAMLQLPNRALLPKAHAEQLGTQFRNVLRQNAGLETEATQAFLGRLEQVYGNYADDVFTQAYETILDKDISKPVRDVMSSVVLDWARERTGMLDQRYSIATELAAADKQPDIASEEPQSRSVWEYMTGAPPKAPPAPKPPPAPPAPPPVAITVDGVPADAVDTFIKNPGSMKIQNMFRNVYGADRLKSMQDQLRARGITAAAN